MNYFIPLTRRDTPNLLVGGIIIIDSPKIADGGIEPCQVVDALPIATTNHIRRDVMTALLDALCHTFDSQLGARQPEVEQQNEITPAVLKLPGY